MRFDDNCCTQWSRPTKSFMPIILATRSTTHTCRCALFFASNFSSFFFLTVFIALGRLIARASVATDDDQASFRVPRRLYEPLTLQWVQHVSDQLLRIGNSTLRSSWSSIAPKLGQPHCACAVDFCALIGQLLGFPFALRSLPWLAHSAVRAFASRIADCTDVFVRNAVQCCAGDLSLLPLSRNELRSHKDDIQRVGRGLTAKLAPLVCAPFKILSNCCFSCFLQARRVSDDRGVSAPQINVAVTAKQRAVFERIARIIDT